MLVQRHEAIGYFAEQQKISSLEVQVWRAYCLIQGYFAEGPKNTVFCLCYNKKTHSIEIWDKEDLDWFGSDFVDAAYVFVEPEGYNYDDLVIFEKINYKKYLSHNFLFFQYLD